MNSQLKLDYIEFYGERMYYDERGYILKKCINSLIKEPFNNGYKMPDKEFLESMGKYYNSNDAFIHPYVFIEIVRNINVELKVYTYTALLDVTHPIIYLLKIVKQYQNLNP